MFILCNQCIILFSFIIFIIMGICIFDEPLFNTNKLLYGGGNKRSLKKTNSNNKSAAKIHTPITIDIMNKYNISKSQLYALTYIDNAVRNPRQTLFYDELSYSYHYDNYGLFKHNCHIGQRKLLLNEIQFFTYYLPQNKQSIIVYVGSAPCEHLTVIQELFPNNKYLLIDPNFCLMDTDAIYIYQNTDVISKLAYEIVNVYKNGSAHQRRGASKLLKMKILDNAGLYNMLDIDKSEQNKIKTIFEDNPINIFNKIIFSKENVFIIQDYMTIDLMKILCRNIDRNKIGDILFISDLRTNFFESGPIDLDILFNDCLQMTALDILQPNYSMLKFHPPYFNKDWNKHLDNLTSEHPLYSSIMTPINYISELTGKDIIAEHKQYKHYNYNNTKILLQPWAPTSSTESRLIISKQDILKKNIINYDSKEWENKYFIIKYQRMYSAINIYDQILSNNTISSLGYCYCYDCFIELSIIIQYIVSRENSDILLNGNIENYIPNEEDQKKIIEQIIYIGSKHINENLKYDLNNKTNKYCKIHSHSYPHNDNYYYMQNNDNELIEIKTSDNGDLEYKKIEDNHIYKLNDIFTQEKSTALQEYIKQYYIKQSH